MTHSRLLTSGVGSYSFRRKNLEVTHIHGPGFAGVCPDGDYETQGNEIAVLGAEVIQNDHASQAASAEMNKALTRKNR